MPKTSAVVIAVCFVVGAAHAQSPVVQGMLRDQGQPITSAEVYLQSLRDKHCVNVFSGKRRDWVKERELDQCLHDQASTPVDANGHFQFAGLKPGWYALHFLWNIREKPEHADVCLKRDNWAVIYAGRKDSTGRYDTIAQDKAFYFSGTEDVVRNFDNRP